MTQDEHRPTYDELLDALAPCKCILVPAVIEAGAMVIGDTSGLHAVFDSAGQRVCYGERQVWP